MKKFMTLLLLSFFLLSSITACNKKEEATTEEVTTEETTTEEVTTEETTTEEVPTEETETSDEFVDAVDEDGNPIIEDETNPPIADEDDEANIQTLSGTFNGFADENSCEVKLDNGSYMVLIVEDAKLCAKLESIDPGTSITFTCSPMANQSNYQLLSLK